MLVTFLVMLTLWDGIVPVQTGTPVILLLSVRLRYVMKKYGSAGVRSVILAGILAVSAGSVQADWWGGDNWGGGPWNGNGPWWGGNSYNNGPWGGNFMPFNGGPSMGFAPNGGPSMGFAPNGGPSMGFAPNGGPSMGFAPNGGPSMGFAPNGGPGMNFGPFNGPARGGYRQGQAPAMRMQPQPQRIPQPVPPLQRPSVPQATNNSGGAAAPAAH